jgi:hypothetical protein
MKSFEEKLLGRLYCFCGGGDDGGNSGSEDEAAAEQRGYDMGGPQSYSMDSLDDDPETGDGGIGTGSGQGRDDNDNDDREREAARQEAARQEAEKQRQKDQEQEAREAEEAARQEAARQESQRAREQREADEREADRLEAEMAAEYARQESARQEAVRQEAERQESARQEAERQEAARQEAERLAAEIARIEAEEAARLEAEMEAEAARQQAARFEVQLAELARIQAEEAARFEAEIEAEAARQEAREAEEARLSSPESLTDDQLDEAIAAYSNANTAVASEVLGRLVEEKEIRTVEKAEEAEDQRLLDQKQEFEEAEIESSDLPGSSDGTSLGDLMAQYGVPSDKITYGIDGTPVIDLGMTTKEIDAIYGGDDQPEEPTTTQQIIDYVTEQAIKTLDANQDGNVSALEFVAPFAVGASGLGIFSNVNTLANKLGITDKNIINELISSVEDGIESLIGFAIPKVGDPTEIDTPVTDLSMTTAEIDALQGGLDTSVTDLPPVPTSTEQSFAAPDFAPGITGKEINGPQVRQDELDRAIQEEIDADRLAEEAENQRLLDQKQEFEEAETFSMDSMSAFDQSPAGGSTTGPDPLSNVEIQNLISGSSGGFSTRPSGTDPGIGILSLGGREYSFDNTVPADQRSYTEIIGSSIIDAAPDMISNLPKDTAEDEAIPVTDLSMTTAEIDALSNIDSMDSMSAFDQALAGGATTGMDSMSASDQSLVGGADSGFDTPVTDLSMTTAEIDALSSNASSNIASMDSMDDDPVTGDGGVSSGFDIPVTDLSMTTAEIDADRLAEEAEDQRRKDQEQEFEEVQTVSMDSMDDDPVTGDFGVDTGSGQIGGLDQGVGGGGSDDNDGNDDDVDEVESVQYTPTVYTFGEPTTFTPTEDLTYREPAITSPFDFARDFGYYTLSPEIADSYVTKELQSYVPTYLKPIGEMTPEEIEELIGIRSIIGPNYPVQTQPIGYPFTTTPEEEAEALLPKE